MKKPEEIPAIYSIEQGENKETVYRGQTPEQYIASLREAGFEEGAEIFEKVLEISRAINEEGGRAMLVGGSVRDEIIGYPIKDYDIEVYELESEKLLEVLQRFGKVSEVGKSYGILKLRVGNIDLDFSLPRSESKTGQGHRDFSVSTDPHMNPRDAARRRDFTFNSLAKDILTGKIFDYFGGVEDLRRRTLRVTNEETFREDPLRVLRGIQFAGRFGLHVEDDTARILRDMRPELVHLPKERLREEWFKLLLKSKKPSIGLSMAMELGIFHQMHEDVIVPLASTPQEPDWHPEGDVWTHTLMAVDEAKKIIDAENIPEQDAKIIMLAILCHDLGKPLTTKEVDGRIRAIGHEKAGEGPAKKFMTQIGIEQSVQEVVLKLVVEHLSPIMLFDAQRRGQEVTDGAIRRLADRIHPATIYQLSIVSMADSLGRGFVVNPINAEDGSLQLDSYQPHKWLLDRARSLNIEHQRPVPVIMGRDIITLGLRPPKKKSAIFGEVLRKANSLHDLKGLSRGRILDLLSQEIPVVYNISETEPVSRKAHNMSDEEIEVILEAVSARFEEQLS